MEYKDEVIWILQQHRRVNQTYGGLPYHVHLENVVKFVKKYINLIPEQYHRDVILAAWGHDLIEDTGLTFNNIVKVLGRRVANIIYAVSNEKGHDRDERANDKYYSGIINDDLALFVKLCDRLSNLTQSKKDGHGMYKKYMQELPHFKEKLYNGMYQKMWDELEDIKFIDLDDEYFPNVNKFDEENIWSIGRLPNPIPGDVYKELYRKGILPKKDLIKGKYYFGKCRNAKVALWNGYEFVYMRDFWGKSFFPETIFHLEDDNGFDVFIPLKEVTPTEEQRIKY
jgi:(p)ppGpp synthase/HD superfamily hydrolase